ncbi:MAG: hypothetical protein ACO3F3_18320 [Gemmataceae bacterium]
MSTSPEGRDPGASVNCTRVGISRPYRTNQPHDGALITPVPNPK